MTDGAEAVKIIDHTWYERPEGVTDRTSAGGIVARFDGSKIFVALTRESELEGFVLPKGGVEDGETYEQAARREIAEETGLVELALLTSLAALERLNYDRDNWVTTHYFLYATGQVDATPLDTKAHEAMWWFPLDDLPEMMWPEQREIIQSNASLIVALIGRDRNSYG